MEADSINHLPRLDSFLSREKSFSRIGRAVWLEEMKRSKHQVGGMLLGFPILLTQSFSRFYRSLHVDTVNLLPISINLQTFKAYVHAFIK